VLVTWDAAVADAVEAVLDDDARATVSVVLVEGPEQAMAAVNAIAPEHLELMTADAETLVPLVRNAGAVFVGPWAPAAVGDYVAGVNHVLPTARTARFASALRVDTFRKHIHVVRVTPDALEAVSEHVTALAGEEGLPAHARSVALRRSTALTRKVP
jgi:histidinol dehydrogenase